MEYVSKQFAVLLLALAILIGFGNTPKLRAPTTNVPAYIMSCVQETCHVTLAREIYSPDFYKPLMKLIIHSKEGYKIVFHLAGFGGISETWENMYAAFRHTKAVIVMVVEKDVYSAHAFLAISGDYLIVHNHAHLFFHSYQCQDEPGEKPYCTKEIKERWAKEGVPRIAQMFPGFFKEVELEFMAKYYDKLIRFDEKTILERFKHMQEG